MTAHSFLYVERTRAVWKELPDSNPRAVRKSRERDLKSVEKTER